MEFVRRAGPPPRSVALLAGAFNPPTRAHLELAHAAFGYAEVVVFTLPRQFPHKAYDGPPLAVRLELLAAAIAAEPRFWIAVSGGGLFIEMARECRVALPEVERIFHVCGRDAAERIANWDYGAPDAFAAQLETYELLVAPRQGVYVPPPAYVACIHALPLPPDWDEVSSTEIRRRIAAAEPWQHLVPASIVTAVAAVYSEYGSHDG